MRWGTIAWVDLDPAQGSEANKIRPGVLVSNDRAIASAERNRRGVVTVLPITTSITRVLSFQVPISGDDRQQCGLDTDSKIQAEQIRSVDIRRVRREIGTLPKHLHEELREALRLHLDL